MSLIAVAVVAACGTRAEPRAPPVPHPAIPTPAPALPTSATSFRYDAEADAWRAEDLGRVGLYFVEHGRTTFRVVGTLCNDVMRTSLPPPGRVTTCVPDGGGASVRDVPDPTPLTASTCFDCVVPTCTRDTVECRPVLARVDDPRGALGPELRDAVVRRWRALIATLARAEVPSPDAGCSSPGGSLTLDDATPPHLVALAARWDLGGLLVSGVDGARIVANVGPPRPAMTGVRLERPEDGEVRFCGLEAGD